MPVGDVFHLTHMVEDLSEAMAFYEKVFAPHCFYRGYAPGYHRDGALLVISEFIIEPIQPIGPTPEQPVESSLFRYTNRFGPRIHSMAFYGTELPEMLAAMDAGGIRAIDHSPTIFGHPKDFPGMVEIFDPAMGSLPDPRQSPGWSGDYWRHSHGLGLNHVSHVTAVVEDHRGAAKLYESTFDCTVLPDQPASTPGAEATFVSIGTETVLELVTPLDDSCPHALALSDVGETFTGATFKVADLDAVERSLTQSAVGFDRVAEDLVTIDINDSLGAVYSFTDRSLAGDSRSTK